MASEIANGGLIEIILKASRVNELVMHLKFLLRQTVYNFVSAYATKAGRDDSGKKQTL